MVRARPCACNGLRTSEPQFESVMCFPDFPVYRSLHAETASSLRAAGIAVWLVTEGGQVERLDQPRSPPAPSERQPLRGMTGCLLRAPSTIHVSCPRAASLRARCQLRRGGGGGHSGECSASGMAPMSADRRCGANPSPAPARPFTRDVTSPSRRDSRQVLDCGRRSRRHRCHAPDRTRGARDDHTRQRHPRPSRRRRVRSYGWTGPHGRPRRPRPRRHPCVFIVLGLVAIPACSSSSASSPS